MKLYRPVGQAEFDLVALSGFRAFPPRLEGQPIFYPVLNIDYARQIAGQWNTKDKLSGYVGYVLAFEVDDAYIEQFEVQTVGAHWHQELWIPAEELPTLNLHIIGCIEVLEKLVHSKSNS